MSHTQESFLEDNIDQFMSEYINHGVRLISHKTKLAKRVYLVISIFNIFISSINFILEANPELRNQLYTFIKDNEFLVSIIFILFLSLIVLIPERSNFTLLLWIPIWLIFIFFFSVFFSIILQIQDYFKFYHFFLTIHHLIMTVIVFLKNDFDTTILLLNILLSIPGIMLIFFHKLIDHEKYISFAILLSLNYFIINLSYWFQVKYFA